MAHLLIGAIAATVFLFILNYTHRRNRQVAWWQWILTILGIAYAVFVLEVIVSFLREGTVRGALAMGVILGVIAVIWGVLLWRFVFSRRTR